WDWEGAAADVDRALALNPRDASTQAALNWKLRTRGRLREAVAAAILSTELEPLAARFWNNLGFCYLTVDEFANARAAFERARANRDGALINAPFNPYVKKLWNEPRFLAFMRSIKAPAPAAAAAQR